MLQLVTPPAELVVSVAELKVHIRHNFSDANEDTYLTGLIESATLMAEAYCNSAFVTQTWKYFLEYFPNEDCFEIPLGPVQSITNIKYYDTAGSLITWDAANYQTLVSGARAKIALGTALGNWPSTKLDKLGAIEVQFVAGYGAASAVPSIIKHAIKLTAGSLYSNREQEISGTTISQFELSCERLLAPYRLYLFA